MMNAANSNLSTFKKQNTGATKNMSGKIIMPAIPNIDLRG